MFQGNANLEKETVLHGLHGLHGFYMGFRETADPFSSDAPGIFAKQTNCELQDLMQNLATLPALPMGKMEGKRVAGCY